jgi:hypothetical protein
MRHLAHTIRVSTKVLLAAHQHNKRSLFCSHSTTLYRTLLLPSSSQPSSSCMHGSDPGLVYCLVPADFFRSQTPVQVQALKSGRPGRGHYFFRVRRAE